MKKILIIIIIVFILSSFLFAGFAEHKRVTLSNWMQLIDDEALFTDVVMPGSHDAATYKCMAWDKNQDLTILQQLNIGTRYFDLRVMDTEFENLGNFENLRIYHGPIPSDATFYEVATDIMKFIEKNPTEFFILDFNHFRNNPYSEMISLIENVLQPEKYALKNTYDITKISMRDIRKSKARFLISWGNHASYSSFGLDYLFNRNDVIKSPYTESFHTESSTKLINEGFPYYYNQADDRLFVLQSQKTGKDFFTLIPYNNEIEFAPFASEFISSLKNDDRLFKTNILMRDFLSSEKTAEIIKLNLAKNLVKTNKISDFKKMLDE